MCFFSDGRAVVQEAEVPPRHRAASLKLECETPRVEGYYRQAGRVAAGWCFIKSCGPGEEPSTVVYDWGTNCRCVDQDGNPQGGVIPCVGYRIVKEAVAANNLKQQADGSSTGPNITMDEFGPSPRPSAGGAEEGVTVQTGTLVGTLEFHYYHFNEVWHALYARAESRHLMDPLNQFEDNRERQRHLKVPPPPLAPTRPVTVVRAPPQLGPACRPSRTSCRTCAAM